jgi:uncharacterized protein
MRRIMLTVVSVAVLTLATDAGRAASPSFDCAKARSIAEKLVCGDGQLAALDRELARLFALARDDRSVTPARHKELVAFQRGWIKGRDECWKSDDLRGCAVDSYVIRIHELRRDYAAARTQDARGVSIGPLVARCSGAEAPIGASLVNVDPSLAYLGWRDRSLVLTQGPSASGARYTRRSDKGEALFWNKGNEALLILPGEPERTCRIEKPG